MQEGDQGIQKIENIGEEVIGISVVQASVHKHLFEELLRKTSPKVKEIESQLAKHELNACLLEPAYYRIIREEAHAWSVFIKKPVGST